MVDIESIFLLYERFLHKDCVVWVIIFHKGGINLVARIEIVRSKTLLQGGMIMANSVRIHGFPLSGHSHRVERFASWRDRVWPDGKDMNQTTSNSPFHPGEQWLQTQVGERDQVETLGRRVIRNHMPEQHRRFYAGLNSLVVGTVDDNDWPWSTVIPGHTGFVTATDEQTLTVRQRPHELDRVSRGLAVDQAVGILGMDLSTRRRNRLNGRIIASDALGFTVAVEQSFGNCPQYIQKREARRVVAGSVAQHPFATISADAANFIEATDTFFVASFVGAERGVPNAGVDVSHRGGRPGFVHVDDNVLTIPDFRGNRHFNTLGNFVLNPKAGLVFPDFERGRLLQLTGRVELLDAPPNQFEGAERAWRFEVVRGQWLDDALPFRYTEPEWSPKTMQTGSWSRNQL